MSLKIVIGLNDESVWVEEKIMVELGLCEGRKITEMQSHSLQKKWSEKSVEQQPLVWNPSAYTPDPMGPAVH